MADSSPRNDPERNQRSGRVSISDLALAQTWLLAYEPGPDDENGERLARVAAWIGAEVERRERRRARGVSAAGEA